MGERATLTTTAGTPIGDNQNAITAGPHGPVLLQDYQLLEKLAHQNRERIPERTVHAKGWGAHGTFTVTHDITKYTKAKIFSEIGKKTETIARFQTSPVNPAQPTRGFAVKFYTEEGNWDLAGNYHKDGPRRFFEPATNPDAFYEPNPFGGPVEDHRFVEPPLKLSGDAARYNHRDGNHDYRQAGDLFRLIGKEAQQRLVNNVAETMQGAPREIVERQLGHFAKADSRYSEGVAHALGMTLSQTAE
jgi:catalase